MPIYTITKSIHLGVKLASNTGQDQAFATVPGADLLSYLQMGVV